MAVGVRAFAIGLAVDTDGALGGGVVALGLLCAITLMNQREAFALV